MRLQHVFRTDTDWLIDPPIKFYVNMHYLDQIFVFLYYISTSSIFFCML